MYKFTIKIPIYDCNAHIIISSDIEKVVNRYVKKKKWDTDLMITDHQINGLTVTDTHMKDYYMFLDIEGVTVNILTHEISHLVDYIMRERDAGEDGEAKAYLTGFVSEKIFDYIFKKELLINKWYKSNKSDDEKPSGLFQENNEDPRGSE